MTTLSGSKIRVAGARGCELLRHVESVDPRVAEGLKRDAAAPATSEELEQVLLEEKRRAITDPYQCFLFDVRAMHKKGNFKGTQGETILHRIRVLGEKGETELDLSGFSIRDDFAELLAPFLRAKSCGITKLNVARTQIGIEGATIIARAVNASMELLQFSETPLTIAVFRKDARATRHAVLSGRQYTHLDAAAIGVLVERESRKLERLDVSGNRFTGLHSNVFYGVSILFNGLKKCLRVKELNLEAVDLRSEGLTDLANAISELSALEKLVLSRNMLSCNSFGDKNLAGVDAFCNELWQAKRLHDLSLADNGLDYVACISLSKMLTVNQQLLRLDLARNPLADAGAVQLVVGIKKTASLETLDVSACDFACQGAHAIADSLRKFNRTIHTISLRDNPGIRSSGFRTLIKCVTVNPTLRIVDVNPPPPKYDAFAQQIRDLLTVNVALATLRTDFVTFDFALLAEPLRTNFVEKLEELSEPEMQRLCSTRALDGLDIGRVPGVDAVVSSLRYYAQMEQYAPLKRLLWVLEAGARREIVDQRPKRKEPALGRRLANVGRGRHDNGNDEEVDEDEDDIWDYPIC